MVNILEIVVVLEHVDELLHVLDVPGVGELDVALGDHLQENRSILIKCKDFPIIFTFYLAQNYTLFASCFSQFSRNKFHSYTLHHFSLSVNAELWYTSWFFIFLLK